MHQPSNTGGINQRKNLYTYKRLIKIPPLGFVDDLATINVCGIDSVMANVFINTQIEMNKENNVFKDGIGV